MNIYVINRIQRIRLVVVALLFGLTALLMTQPLLAQDADAAHATITVTEGDFTVGDPIALTLRVEHPADAQVIIPVLATTWGDFEVRAQSAAVTEETGDGNAVTEQTIDVVRFAPGTEPTPPLAITLIDSAGQSTELYAPPVEVSIESMLPAGETTLRDIKPQVDLPVPSVWPLYAAAGAAALAIVGLLVWLVRRRRGTLDTRLPHEIAFDELARITHLNLPAADRFKEHYTLVTDAVRRYLEHEYGIDALDRTVAELRDAIRHSPITRKRELALLDLFMDSSLVKFAKLTPTVADAETFTARAGDEINALMAERADQRAATDARTVESAATVAQ